MINKNSTLKEFSELGLEEVQKAFETYIGAPVLFKTLENAHEWWISFNKRFYVIDNDSPVRASDLETAFPKSEKLTDEKQSKINNAISKNGIVSPDLRTDVNSKGIKTILATDQKGANRFYNDLDNENKFENGDDKYVRTPAIKKEINERQENLYPSITKAKLEHSEKGLEELSKNSKVEELRQIEKSRNDKQLPQVKQKKIKNSNSRDELTGELIEKGDVHHKERVADNPRKQNDMENLVYTAPQNHKLIHTKDAESKNELEQLANDEGWLPQK